MATKTRDTGQVARRAAILALEPERLTVAVVAKRLDCSIRTVVRHRAELGLKHTRRADGSIAERFNLAELYMSGLRSKAIAARTGQNYHTVCTAIRRLKVAGKITAKPLTKNTA